MDAQYVKYIIGTKQRFPNENPTKMGHLVTILWVLVFYCQSNDSFFITLTVFNRFFLSTKTILG